MAGSDKVTLTDSHGVTLEVARDHAPALVALGWTEQEQAKSKTPRKRD